MNNKKEIIKIGCRASRLSLAQCEEVAAALASLFKNIECALHLFETTGDKDLKTSLLSLDKTDFFTKEIDEALLSGAVDVAIHSAKDLPEPLPKGLALIALTQGVDPRDVIVISPTLKTPPVVGVSSERRIAAVKTIWPNALCKDIRGTIERRLSLLDSGEYDAVVMAEAALVRLGLTERPRIYLNEQAAPLQGKLAIIARDEDARFLHLFMPLDSRLKPLPRMTLREKEESTHLLSSLQKTAETALEKSGS